MITLVTGLILTATFATLAIGELNLISVAFAVLYIGLGIDFAIHYCLRYRELLINGESNAFAIVEASRNLGHSLFICTISTALGFFAFIPTDYSGVAELGLISGVGMFISLFVTLSLLPALLGAFPVNATKIIKLAIGSTRSLAIAYFPLAHAGKILVIAAMTLMLSLGLITQVKFDPNILNLQDPKNESVKTFTTLLKSSDTSPWTGVIVSDNRDDAVMTKSKIEDLTLVDKVVWLEDFVPEGQDEKLLIIDDLNLLLPGGFSDTQLSTVLTAEEKFQVLTQFLDNHKSINISGNHDYLTAFIEQIQGYVDNLTNMADEKSASYLNNLSDSMLASLPGRLKLLNASLNADYISLDNIPIELKQRWISDGGNYLLSIYPAEDLNDNQAMRRFVEDLYLQDQRLIGSPVVNIEAGDAVITAFSQALSYAICAIALFLFLLLPRKTDSLIVLSMLLFAVMVTGGISVLLGIPLNFANIIALPLLLGIGVDSSIHILHRFRTALPEHNNILATSSARAVIVSTLTTMGSIGNLAFSPHAGTASMGMLLTIGIAMTLITTLIVLPGLLNHFRKANQTGQPG